MDKEHERAAIIGLYKSNIKNERTRRDNNLLRLDDAIQFEKIYGPLLPINFHITFGAYWGDIAIVPRGDDSSHFDEVIIMLKSQFPKEDWTVRACDSNGELRYIYANAYVQFKYRNVSGGEQTAFLSLSARSTAVDGCVVEYREVKKIEAVAVNCPGFEKEKLQP